MFRKWGKAPTATLRSAAQQILADASGPLSAEEITKRALEDKNPLAGKKQAREYAGAQNCRFVILSTAICSTSAGPRARATHIRMLVRI